MTTRDEAHLVVVSSALALSLVFACLAVSPGLWNSAGCVPQVSQVAAPLTPRSPVLEAKGQNLSAANETIEFSVGRPADLHGSWTSTSPVYVGVFDFSLFCGTAPDPPIPIGSLNGTINETLFPGVYILDFEWFGDHANSTWTATESIAASFDRGLDVLAGPGATTIASPGYAAWTITAPAQAYSYFLEWAMTTSSCNDELAVLPPRTFQAFESGLGPLNGNGTDVIETSSTSPCAAMSGTSTEVGDLGPSNWSSGDVLVYFNGGGTVATLTLLAPLEASYRMG
jgi:hypothetical protein